MRLDKEPGFVKRGDGLYVLMVAEGSPAQKAGIRRGDFIESIQGQSTANASSILLQVWLSFKPIGTPVEITLRRGEKLYKATMATADRQARPELNPYDLFYVITGVKLRKEADEARAGKAKFYAAEVAPDSLFGKKIEPGEWFSGLVTKAGVLSAVANYFHLSARDIAPLAGEEQFRASMGNVIWYDEAANLTPALMYVRWGSTANPAWSGLVAAVFTMPVVL